MSLADVIGFCRSIAALSLRGASVALLVSLCACGATPPKGPQPTGSRSSAVVGEAELSLRYRYEILGEREITLLIDAVASSGEVGPIAVTVQLDGFSVVSGDTTWSVTPRTEQETHAVTLRADVATPKLTVVTRHRERDIELASDTLRFFRDEWVRECEVGDEGC